MNNQPSSLDEHRQQGNWIIIDGLKIFTRLIGQGPPLLLLHGFPTSSYDFSRILSRLAENHTLLLFDFPGYGFSDKPDSNIYSISYFAEITQKILTHYGFNELPVVAHDIGDSVCLVLLGESFPKITKLVMMNANIIVAPFHDKKLLFGQRILLYTLAGRLVSKLGLVNRSFFASLLKSAFYTPLSSAELDTFWYLFQYNRGNTIYYQLIQYMKERLRQESVWLDNLLKSDIPITLIWGEDDPIAPKTIPRQACELRPNITTHIPLQNTRHYPQWETPEPTAHFILEALRNS